MVPFLSSAASWRVWAPKTRSTKGSAAFHPAVRAVFANVVSCNQDFMSKLGVAQGKERSRLLNEARRFDIMALLGKGDRFKFNWAV